MNIKVKKIEENFWRQDEEVLAHLLPAWGREEGVRAWVQDWGVLIFCSLRAKKKKKIS